MGLDIYLYPAVDAEASDAHNKIWNDIWGYGEDGNTKIADPSPWDRMSEAEKTAFSAAHPYPSHKDVPSEIDPAHLMNRAYLRSSYNGGGFNGAVPEMIGRPEVGLYWIFEDLLAAHPEYEPDYVRLTEADFGHLDAAAKRAEEIAEALSICDMLRVTTISPNMFSGPASTTDDGALAFAREALARKPFDGEEDSWWENATGSFFGRKGMTIVAAVPGADSFKIPCTHLVWRGDDDGRDWYVKAARIVADFCAYAKELVERDGWARMSWSG